MKASPIVLILLAAVSALGSAVPSNAHPHGQEIVNGNDYSVGRGYDAMNNREFTKTGILQEKREEAEKEVKIIKRCRAQELSPGSALGIMIVLATGSAIHMRGSAIFKRAGGLYRIAPEFGILEAMTVLLLVAKGLFIYRRSLKISVLATLTLRYFRAEDDLWWQGEEASSPANCYEQTRPAFERIERFGPDRVLADGLMVLAIIKAFAAKGTIRTNLLAASYGLSFFTIELLALVALHIGPPRTREELETEALKCTELLTLLDSSDKAWEHRVSPRWQNSPDDKTRFKLMTWVLAALYGLPAALNLIFSPFSVPIFVVFDFTEKHKGKWIFTYSTFLLWTLWIVVAASGLALLIVLLGLVLWRSPGRREHYWEFWRKRSKPLEGWYKEGRCVVDIYAPLKFALITRYYIWWYTGQGTTKPAWLDWLG
jgi:hypothetical protein